MVSIIFPAYNEQDAIAETIQRAKDAFSQSKLKSPEIIVVDDGSTDETAARAESAGATVVHHVLNMGYGKSLKDGITAAKNDTIVICDADGTYPIEKIPDLVKEYQNGYDMVIGIRKGKFLDSSIFKSILRWFLKLIVEFTAGRRIPDINSGLRVFSKKTILPYFSTLSNTFSFTTSSTLAYLLDFRYVLYTPIEYFKRAGKTKVRLYRDSLRTLQFIVEVILYYNPLKLFLFFSFIFMLISGVCLAITFSCQVTVPYCAPVGFGFMFLSLLSFLFGLFSIQLKQIRR